MKQVPKSIWIILGLLLFLNLISIGIALWNPSGKSYPQQVVQKGTAGPVGAIGSQGDQGQPGMSISGPVGAQGIQGASGVQGPAPTTDQVAAAVTTYIQANPPAAGPQGPQGAQGDPGQDGAQVELRINPHTGNVEWKHDGDLNWAILLHTCQLTNSCQ